jgi:hypothetical protein
MEIRLIRAMDATQGTKDRVATAVASCQPVLVQGCTLPRIKACALKSSKLIWARYSKMRQYRRNVASDSESVVIFQLPVH